MQQEKLFWKYCAGVLAGALALLLPLVVLFWMGRGADPSFDALMLQLALTVGAVALGCYGGLRLLFARFVFPTYDLSDETRLISAGDHGRRVDEQQAPPLSSLAQAINELASRYADDLHDVEQKIAEARADTDRERNILSALMGELSEGVIVCTMDGQILLYNDRAHDLLLEHDKEKPGSAGMIGLGRSVFNSIDRNVVTNALEDLIYKLDEDPDRSPGMHFVTSVKNERFLRVRLALIVGEERSTRGFVLVLDDVTPEVRSSTAQARLRSLLDSTPEVDATSTDELSFFRKRLGGLLQQWGEPGSLQDRDGDQQPPEEAEHSDSTSDLWPLDAMLGADLLDAIAHRAHNQLGIELSVEGLTGDIWIHVDSFSAVNAMLFLLQHAKKRSKEDQLRCVAEAGDEMVQISVLWDGAAVSETLLETWHRVPVLPPSASEQLTLNEVLTRHRAELRPVAETVDEAGLSLRLPVAHISSRPRRSRTRPTISGRPIYYDFALLDKQRPAAGWDGEPLQHISYTVFDTETTGLKPKEGDKIISLGAARIVNGRILQGETFDQLVDPQRPLSLDSVRIHGIQPSMLRGKPTILDVLPHFGRFVEDTVLVGHNVAFDLSFIRRHESEISARFDQPVLDTLLLASIVLPELTDFSLDALADRLNLSATGRHTALGDAMITAELLLKLIPLLKQQSITTLGEAQEASRQSRFANLSY